MILGPCSLLRQLALIWAIEGDGEKGRRRGGGTLGKDGEGAVPGQLPQSKHQLIGESSVAPKNRFPLHARY